MDQNLAGIIAANVTLIQPMHVLVINALIGPISALIGAGAVYLASQRSEKHEEVMMLERERQEKAKTLREERKNAYIKYLCMIDKIINTETPINSEETINAMSQAYNELVLFASKDILDKADIILRENKEKDLKEQSSILWQEIKEYMRTEMQDT